MYDSIQEIINTIEPSVDETGTVRSLKHGQPGNYQPATVFRERVYFSCAVAEIE